MVMKPFKVTEAPLSGRNLIEASAGTGKTYAIEGLFLRLILEKQIPINQILVVTFTEAATTELKERIWNRLMQEKSAFQTESSDVASEKAAQLIQGALDEFDRAAIFTIHGFCQRILQENTFETGNLFDTELVTNPSEIMQEVADDFWRKNFYDSQPELISYAIKKMKGPENFLKLLARARAGDIRIVPDLEKPLLLGLGPFRSAFSKLKKRWPSCRADMEKLLKSDSLRGNIYGSRHPDRNRSGMTGRDSKVLSIVLAMDKLTNDKNIGFPLFKEFQLITYTKLMKSVKKNQVPPSHEFFHICEELYARAARLEDEMSQYLIFLKKKLFEYVGSELSSRKMSRNVQFFDDLITRVQKSLQNNKRSALVNAIRQKYRAALVDEFQDTDSIQNDIFSKIFSFKNSILFMIGDPKQAIYGFRGADIFSYLNTAANTNTKYTLIENWRSVPSLVTAVNTLFSNIKVPFVFKEIAFKKGRSAKTANQRVKMTEAPLKLWFIRSDWDHPINKTDAVQKIAAQVTREISRLITRDEKAFKPEDIAILVRTNRQAQMMKTCLSAERIPSVLLGAENIFDSHEARELERVLTGIADHGSGQLLRAAMVTDMIGISGNDFDTLDADSLWWRTLISNFKEYFEVWSRSGFIRMFRLFMAKEQVRSRLLSFEDGERRLTNLLHLAEILHQESDNNNKGVEGLIKWLSEQSDPASLRLEEHQLRLESDENAVRIVTTHKSKGLEYDVVFYPFGWEGSLIKEKEIFFHDHDANQRLTLDLNPDTSGKNRISAQNELLAENLRLLYVAVTRAKIRCYLTWGQIRGTETSAMAYLFHGSDCSQGGKHTDDILSTLKTHFSTKTDGDLLEDLKGLVNRSSGSIELVTTFVDDDSTPASTEERGDALFLKRFSGQVKTNWKISSYSSLVSHRASEIELLDRDSDRSFNEFLQNPERGELESDPKTISDSIDIFSFPKGPRAGIFFHEIFEEIDFAAMPPAYEHLVIDKLNGYGFEVKWKETVCGMIKRVLSAPLLKEGNHLVLSTIQQQDRISEMEFYFPLNPISPHTLRKVFADYGPHDISADFPTQLEKLTFSPVEGFMKGYIDMVFQYDGRYYLLDWKSNFLGMSSADYNTDSIRTVMGDNFYILQYHIYILALHQYLGSRMPGYRYETNFGGVFYLFIRGIDMDNGAGNGIYYDRPAIDLIHALGRTLIPSFEPK